VLSLFLVTHVLSETRGRRKNSVVLVDLVEEHQLLVENLCRPFWLLFGPHTSILSRNLEDTHCTCYHAHVTVLTTLNRNSKGGQMPPIQTVKQRFLQPLWSGWRIDKRNNDTESLLQTMNLSRRRPGQRLQDKHADLCRPRRRSQRAHPAHRCFRLLRQHGRLRGVLGQLLLRSEHGPSHLPQPQHERRRGSRRARPPGERCSQADAQVRLHGLVYPRAAAGNLPTPRHLRAAALHPPR